MEYALPDGTQLTLPERATGADAAAAIGPGLARAALAVKVGDELRDLARPLPDGAGPAKGLEIVTERSGEEALALIRHDAAHVLAAAVLDLYPGVKVSIGPAIDDGFYYDFEFPPGVTVSDADFERIEARMQEHIDADEPFVRDEVPVAEALERFRSERPGLQGRVDRGPDPTTSASRPCRCTPTATSPTCAAGRTPRPRSGSRRSSCSRSQAPTGAGTRTGRSSRACMGPRSSRARTSTSTSSGSSARAPTTTAGSVRSSGCSRSQTSRPGPPSGCRPEPRSSTRSSR